MRKKNILKRVLKSFFSDDEHGMPLFVKSEAGTVALPQLPKAQPAASVVQTYQDPRDPDAITGYFAGLPSLNPGEFGHYLCLLELDSCAIYSWVKDT